MNGDYETGSTTWAWPPDSAFMEMDQLAPTDTTYKARRSRRPTPRWTQRVQDSSVFASEAEVDRARTPDSGALPGELLTEAVAANLEGRRVLTGIFRKLAQGESITSPTLAALEGFVDALPRAKSLPTVSPDGDGGLTLAWSVLGHGRTLVTVADGVLYGVGDAGTPQAAYLPATEFTGTLPEDLLNLIPE